MTLITNQQEENRKMSLRDQIFGLLEPDERQRVIAQQNASQQRERFEQQYEWFYDSVVIPVFQQIRKEFSSLGRTADIFPPFHCGLPTAGFAPKLRIVVPKGRTVRYWIEIKPKGDQFHVEQHLAVNDNKIRSDHYKIVSNHKQVVNDLSEIRKEDISQYLIEQYQCHVKNTKSRANRDL